MNEDYRKGVEDAIEYFKSEFAKWESCQYGAGILVKTFSEMVAGCNEQLLNQSAEWAKEYRDRTGAWPIGWMNRDKEYYAELRKSFLEEES